MYAYGTSRTVVRKTKIRRHAMDDISELCGARDTVCGKVGTNRLGPWVDGDPDNCALCVTALARIRAKGLAA